MALPPFPAASKQAEVDRALTLRIGGSGPQVGRERLPYIPAKPVAHWVVSLAPGTAWHENRAHQGLQTAPVAPRGPTQVHRHSWTDQGRGPEPLEPPGIHLSRDEALGGHDPWPVLLARL